MWRPPSTLTPLSTARALSVAGRGRELFELMCEGIVAKRLADPYGGREIAGAKIPHY